MIDLKRIAACFIAAGAAALGVAHAQLGPYQTTTTGSIDATTACPVTFTRTISVPQSFVISDLDVGFLATHSYRTDIQLDLTSPAGTTVRLINGLGFNGINYDNYNVVLDDEASDLINTGSHASSDGTSAPPYENNVRPDNALSAFDGQNAQGTWTLTICDTYGPLDDGQFVRANLYFNSADLSLAMAASTTTPAVGANFTYTITVSNAGPSPASGVAVTDVLPAGVTYVSDNGGGAYNSATGVWTIAGTIASGGTASLQITASPAASGSYVNFAEISAANASDPDSTPNNSGTTPSEDDTAFVTITVGGGGGGPPPVLTCSAGSGQLNWDANSWPGGSLTQSYTASSTPFAFNFTGDTARLLTNFNGQTMPITSSDLTGGLSPAQNSLLYVANYQNTSQSITLTMNVGNSGAGVAKLQFSIFDVDLNAAGNNSGFVDQLQVTGSLGGSLVIPTLTAGAANTTSGVTATGTAPSASTSADGTVVVTFQQPVDTVTITYGEGPGAPSNPGQQGIAVHDVNFCKNGTATLIAGKTVAVYDPSSAGLFSIPGNDVVYSITTTNIGTGAADAGTILIIDSIPAELTFYFGDMDGAGPATGPVYFTQSGAGLTFTQASDVAYSNSAARPTTFAACTYSPAAGYDANIKHVCINPKGAMLAGTPNPTFTVQFRARIN